MEGIISSYRRGRHRFTGNQMIVLCDGVSNREAAQALVGKTVEWTTPAKNTVKGTVASAHGSKGALRVLFEKGMPGQAVTTKVKIL